MFTCWMRAFACRLPLVARVPCIYLEFVPLLHASTHRVPALITPPAGTVTAATVSLATSLPGNEVVAHRSRL